MNKDMEYKLAVVTKNIIMEMLGSLLKNIGEVMINSVKTSPKK